MDFSNGLKQQMNKQQMMDSIYGELSDMNGQHDSNVYGLADRLSYLLLADTQTDISDDEIPLEDDLDNCMEELENFTAEEVAEMLDD